MRNAAMTCPQCGAPFRYKGASRTSRCEYCGNDLIAVEFAFSATRADEAPGPVAATADFIVEGTVLIEYVGSGEDVVVPELITEIAPQAFRGAEVETVSLPSTLEKIGWSAFEGCAYLSDIAIPEGVTVIEREAFSGCASLETVHLPLTLTEIEDWAFESCGSLEHITVPEGVLRIGCAAFSYCDSLTSVVLPSTIAYLEDIDGAFEGCYGLERVSCRIAFEDYDDWEIEGVFSGSPVLESIRRRCGRCVICGDDAEPNSDTCEFCS